MPSLASRGCVFCSGFTLEPSIDSDADLSISVASNCAANRCSKIGVRLSSAACLGSGLDDFDVAITTSFSFGCSIDDGFISDTAAASLPSYVFSTTLSTGLLSPDKRLVVSFFDKVLFSLAA